MPDGTHALTRITGTVTPGGSYTMTDHDVRVFLARSNPGVTAPSGEPRRHEPAVGTIEGLDARQYAAKAKLAGLWHLSLPARGGPRGLEAPGLRDEPGEISPSEAWGDYRAAMDELTRCCGQDYADAVRMNACYDEPSPLWRAHKLRDGLTWLADWWKLK